jgi:hypothetical protein
LLSFPVLIQEGGHAVVLLNGRLERRHEFPFELGDLSASFSDEVDTPFSWPMVPRARL